MNGIKFFVKNKTSPHAIQIRRIMLNIISLSTALSVFILASTCMSYASSDTRKSLYKANIIYRSRVENTTKYIRKINFLHTVSIEKIDSHFISRTMEKIDDPNSKQDLLKDTLQLLGLTGGTFKAVGKAFELEDYAKKYRSEPSGFKENDKMRYFDTALNDVFSAAAKDRAFAKLVDKYLGEQFGPIAGTETEILDSYPPFADHIAIQKLKESFRQKNLSDDEIKTQITDLKLKIDDLTNPNISEETYEQWVTRVTEAATFGTLVATLVGIKDPKTGTNLQNLVNVLSKVAMVSGQKRFNKMSSAAAGANYALVAIELVNLAQENQDPNLIISEQISQLTELIVEYFKQSFETMEILNEKLNIIITTALQIQRDLRTNITLTIDVIDRIDEFENMVSDETDTIKRLLKDNRLILLRNEIGNTIGQKSIIKPAYVKTTSAKFLNAVTVFNAFAMVESAKLASELNSRRSTSAADISNSLSLAFVFDEIPFIIDALNDNTQSNIQNIMFDVPTFMLSASALVEQIKDWPEHQSKLKPEFVGDVAARAEFLISLINALKKSEALSILDRQISLKAKSVSANIVAALLEDIIDQQAPFGRNKFVKIYSEAVSNANDIRSLLKQIPCSLDNLEVEVNFKTGSYGKINLNAASKLLENIPQEICNLYALGLIRLSAKLEWTSLFSTPRLEKRDFELIVEWDEEKKGESGSTLEPRNLTILRSNYLFEGDPNTTWFAPYYVDEVTPQMEVDSYFASDQFISNIISMPTAIDSLMVEAITRRLESLIRTSIDRSLKSDSSVRKAVQELEGLQTLSFKITELVNPNRFIESDEGYLLLMGSMSPLEMITNKIVILDCSIKQLDDLVGVNWQEKMEKIRISDRDEATDNSLFDVTTLAADLREIENALRTETPVRSEFALSRARAQN